MNKKEIEKEKGRLTILREQIRKSFDTNRPEYFTDKEFKEYKEWANKRLHSWWYIKENRTPNGETSKEFYNRLIKRDEQKKKLRRLKEKK